MNRKILIACMVVISICSQAQSPDWQVNAGQYNYSMTVVGMIKNDGVPVSNASSLVAAFINGELRGVATPVFVPALNRSIYYLLVYSNDSGGNITFKYYDADQDVVVNTPQTLSFVIDGLTGNPQNPFVWSNRVTGKTANITSFSFPEQYNSQIYNDTIIAVSVPENYGLTSVITSFATSAGATVFVSGQEVVSGDAIDYSSVVRLTVRSEDEQTVKRYRVKIPALDLVLTTRTLYDRSPAGSFVGKLTSAGFDVVPAYTFGTCSPATDNAAFSIRKDSVFINSMALYATQPEYDVCIRATDNYGLYYEKSFHVSVTDVNFAPRDLQFTFSALHDRDPVGKFVGKLTTADFDSQDTHVYSLGSCESNVNNASFTIRQDSVFTNTVIEYDDNTSLELCLRTTDDDGLYYEKSFTIPVLDVNFAPTDLLFEFTALRDLDQAGKFVGVLKAVDPDPRDTYTYDFGTCTVNTGNPYFVIRRDSVFTADVVRYTEHASFDVCFRANDSGGLSFERSYRIPVINSYPPTDILIETLTVEEGNPKKYFISTIQAVDEDVDDTFIYTLVPGDGDADNAQFYIGQDSLYLVHVAYYDVKEYYTFRVRATDAKGAFYEKKFDVEVIQNPRAAKNLPSVNYVSPNDDGINDYWIIKNVGIYNDFSLHIFDQFGNVIYRKDNNYNNEWDGKLNGKALPDGSYYYVFRNEQKVYRGIITIVNK